MTEIPRPRARGSAPQGWGNPRNPNYHKPNANHANCPAEDAPTSKEEGVIDRYANVVDTQLLDIWASYRAELHLAQTLNL